MKSTWKRIWAVFRSILGWWILGIIILVTVLYLYAFPWTGFGDYATPTGDFVRGKTLWDWMQLLIIPLFLAAGAIAVNRSEKEIERQRAEDRAKLEREIATDRQQEAALQAYLDRMADLLLKENLRTSSDSAEVRNVARIRTLTVLRGLDSRRKGLVINFLQEASLIDMGHTIVSLYDADLRFADLNDAYLKDTELSGTNLSSANLSNAILNNVSLHGALLENADLSGANLSGANLQVTKLQGANLKDAILIDTYLGGANLRGANLEGAHFERTNLDGATMPDGAQGVGIYPIDMDPNAGK